MATTNGVIPLQTVTTNGVSPPPDLTDTNLHPVWEDDGKTDVQSLFKNPYFVEGNAMGAGKSWYDNMALQGLFLYDTPTQHNNVFSWGPRVYNKLSPGTGGNMPFPVPDYAARFPPEALEKFRLWYNDGGRNTIADPIDPVAQSQQIPPPPPPTPPRTFVVPANPVWDSKGTQDDIIQCFTNPCWIAGGSDYANMWRDAMMAFQFDASIDPNVHLNLQQYDHVKAWARIIYTHVASLSMPIAAPFFSDEACEAIRLWYNQGCPQTIADIGKMPLPTDPIPPEPVEKPFIVRKDINTLTPEELQAYRMKIMSLQTGSTTNSTWQVGGFIHANWCLHYMEASFPWHRAHLLWLESQIGGPIPYWNFYSSKSTDPSSGDSGIPQAFLDDTFVGTDQKTYPNPLKHALARNGVSRASTKANPLTEVQRAAEFSDPTQRSTYITTYVQGYLDQIYHAIQSNNLGSSQAIGFPFTWAIVSQDFNDPFNLNDLSNIQGGTLADKQKALQVFYSQVQDEFDGILEQAHDNFHGFVGPDMGNNSYAAFDPIFWSYHANFDRLFEGWVRAHDQQQWSSNYPLRPFIGRDGAITVDEGDKFTYRYTTIGNMVINSKALGYTYAPPGNPDYQPAAQNISMEIAPIVLFPETRCTPKTYIIHVALNPTNDTTPLQINAPGYVGSITRLGMGPNDGNNRCIKGGVVRRLEGSKALADLAATGVVIKPNTEIPLKMQVIEDSQGVRTEVPVSTFKDWPGFRPLVVWGKPVAGIIGH